MTSPDDLLWNAVQHGGFDSDQWMVVIDHLFRQLESFLDIKLTRSDNAYLEDGRSLGFSVDFWSAESNPSPVDLCLKGTFGASNHPGNGTEYIAVQGWLFLYVAGKRVASIENNYNHIHLRYARADAAENDWEMTGCSAPGAWRSFGWESDVHGEFDGMDNWSPGL